jgi:hypothetical protein
MNHPDGQTQRCTSTDEFFEKCRRTDECRILARIIESFSSTCPVDGNAYFVPKKLQCREQSICVVDDHWRIRISRIRIPVFFRIQRRRILCGGRGILALRHGDAR